MATPSQIRQAEPEMRDFLTPILWGAGRTIRGMGAKRAEMLGEDPKKKSSQYGEEFGRLLRDRKQSKSPAKYPRPETAWHYAEVFRYAGDAWAAGPLVLYAVGHLEPFVEVIATVDQALLPPPTLLKMLEVLHRAVKGSASARKVWTLDKRLQAAFWDPMNAAKHLPRPMPDDVIVAHSIARHFDMPYDLQRRTILDFLMRWLQSTSRKATA